MQDKVKIHYSFSTIEDYWIIDDITVKIEDKKEKERVEQRVKEHNLIGSLEYPDKIFIAQVAERLDVDKEMIDIDSDNIDVMSR